MRRSDRWKQAVTWASVPVVASMAMMVAPAADASTSSAKAVTEFAFVSSPGDYIGQGETRDFTSPPATITLSGQADYLTLSVSSGGDYWTAVLAAPRGRVLQPGQYRHAERAPFRSGLAPGLDVFGDGRGCNEVYGSFDINQISTDDSGNVTLLDATFVQHCESAKAPPLHGTILFSATPLSYSYHSDAGDYIGGGGRRAYYGDTSTFSLYGSASAVSFSVSGLRDNWTANLSAPTGAELHKGHYDNAQRFADDAHPGLDVYGDGRGCNQTTGEFTVNAIKLRGGEVVAFAATFVQHCEGASPALHGTIHFHA